MRAFIAIEASAEVRAAVSALATELGDRVQKARWIPSANLHLTLRFLGDTDEAIASALSNELGPIVSECAPFRLEFRGIGFFPSPRRPRVLSALIPQPPRELHELYRRVEATVNEHGFPPERRAFTPHLTFARFRTPSGGLREIQTELQNRTFGHTSVEEVIVFESVLKRSGAVYHPRARLPLRGVV